MNEILTQIFRLLHLPILSTDNIFGQIGFYTETFFAFVSFLLVINLILKFFRREEVFTGWTTFLLIIVPTALIIFSIIWLIPEKVENAWKTIKPPSQTIEY